MSEISEEIIKGCARKDIKCQKIVYEEYYKRMYAVCLRYVSNRDEAKDLLHDGFIKLFDKIRTFREYPKFEAWMRRLFANHCIDYVRSAYKKYMVYHADEHILRHAESSVPESDTDDKDIFSYSSEQLIEAFHKLRPDYRVIINLFAIEGYSHQEISEKLGIEYATSRSKLQRARQSLRQILQEMKKN